MPILLLAVRIACAVQFGLRVRTVDGRTLPELTSSNQPNFRFRIF
jgi:hypothetical protein